MKKFFPLCLLLIVALVWTVSIAGDEGFITKSHQPDVAKKAPAVEKDKTVAKTEKVARVAPVYGDINADKREDVVARARALKSSGEHIPASITPSHEKSAIPKTRAERAAPVEEILIDDRTRLKDIKADGVISPDERAQYEELLSLAPSVELPVPLNIVSEVEPNDTCPTGNLIACGDTVWCADLTFGTDNNDWYTFTLTNEQQVTIETHGPAAGVCDPPIVDTWLELWSGDCQTMLASDDDGGVGMYSLIVMNLTAGTYAINSDATHWGGQTGSYHLSLLCEDPPVIWNCTVGFEPDGKNAGGVGDLEPNDLCVEASPAMCEYAYCGVISTDTDVDWYSVVLPNDTSYALHIRVFGDDTPGQYAYGLGLDPWVGLYASDCSTLVTSSEDYFGTFPDAETYDSQIDPGDAGNCFAPGDTVHIAIQTNYNNPGPYLLIINCEPCELAGPVWSCEDDPPFFVPPDGKLPGGYETEPNDTCTTADDAMCEYAYCGDLSSDADHDWYRVVLPQDGTYGLHIRVFANDTPNQYAQGGGLDPKVNLYASDCVTLVASNDDYNGTFPDAEVFDSQIDPGGANCFFPGDTVYIEIMTPWSPLGGPYLLIINCVPCVIPTGACCVDEVCVATNTESECDALLGEWWIAEDCSAFVRCGPIGNCDNAIYNNGAPADQYGSPASQCIYDFGMGCGAADDITLTQDEYVSKVITWTSHWNGNVGGPNKYDGINVTFYRDDLVNPGQPGGYPDTSGNCTHVQTTPGGVYSTQFVPMGMVNWEQDTSMTCTTDRWMLEIYLPTLVQLLADTLYWLEIQPIMSFGNGGQSAIVLSSLNTGAGTMQFFDAFPWASIAGNSATCDPYTPGIYKDLAFCLIPPPAPVWSCVDDPPNFVPPDGKLAGGYETEPNDTCTTANEALCEYAYCGDLSSDADYDWYRVVIPAGGTSGLHVRVFANDTPNQYAQGGGLDPRVALYASDCVTLLAQNDDYNGTFPDAEAFDSQIDPGGANCFYPGDTVYIEVMTPWSPLGGPYLLIINCVPCEIPTGACCVDEECVATNTQDECALLQGEWWIGEDCSTFVRCGPIGNCDNAIYNNGAPVDQYGSPASQCIYDFGMGCGAVDDITLTADAEVIRIITWTSHWNGNVGGPARYDGMNVTFYRDDVVAPGQPGGFPDTSGNCTHVQTSPGGVYSTQFVPTGMLNWEQDTSMTCTTDRWMLEIHLTIPVQLLADTLYWLEIQPIMSFGNGGQSAIVLSDLNTGADAMQFFDAFPWASISGNSATCDPFTPGIYRNLAFCLLAEAVGCDYVVGDVNGTDSYNGMDISYGVNFFKGGDDPICDTCDCPPNPFFWVCGDVNGTCSYNGMDISYGVNYFKGGPDPIPCPDCPPAGGPAGDISKPETPSVIKTKAIIQKGPSSK